MIQSEFFNTLRFARRLKRFGIDRKDDKLLRDIAYIGYFSGRRDRVEELSASYGAPIEEFCKHSACGAERNW